MATVHQNLSDYDFDAVPDAGNMRFALVVAEWNHKITFNLLKGAKATLLRHGAKEENIAVHTVPGSFELPLGAQMALESAQQPDAVVCLGSVIQGETKHFDFVCQGTALGIQDVALKYGKPVIFGVLTDNVMQQALDRSGGRHGNKGDEAAVTAIKMVALSNEI